MEKPVRDIPGVIHSLTQTPPNIQQDTINTYFTPTAKFVHPFCRTWYFGNSRWLIWAIYRWYKIMSPHIELTVNSVDQAVNSNPPFFSLHKAFDAPNMRLYVSISQIFRIWFIPFIPPRHVSLVTVLDLTYESQRGVYLINSQEDLYQVNEYIKFFLPGGSLIWTAWQWSATALCIVGALLLSPVTLWELKAQKG
ncbi:MAG: hypothetical protein M1837_001865 [Sclerophora amabilis]|nr:MAG: hypothetical protein M1837_001865 [Sclerophora amabilis]